ncbi:MAG: ATP-binding protein [Devosia sp. 67-54]|mgnify:CR=1 FL=1|uniref:ATP-binding protein n=1 Tax=unclassified Devosia TaxID=196773 RepID=UPI0009692BB1|nr:MULTISPECIES: ATP-binding protein [unclassified Devosia]MBN9304820.1 ATP-binding protein [Devosia sp.]OJX15220.1 MAG: ATP-binding protein [Devosia sp. 67-54]
MSRRHVLPPSASSLAASMRDLGYSLETAVADLVDNSISARATQVDIVCDLEHDSPSLAVIDNGSGMSTDELLIAMRHGAGHPGDARRPDDLGRFGLGLKTASFSQCRRLTVLTLKDGALSGAEWDLDLIDREDEWALLVLEPEEAAGQPVAQKLAGHGTAVIWRNLDRLFEDERGDRRHEIVNEKLDALEKHLALVFHRFLAGEIRGVRKLTIAVNGHPVAQFDPFCRKNPATQILPEEVVRVAGAEVHIQPYILPHHSRLTAAEYDFYQSRSDFLSNQGAYIYRNGRLMAWGDWFRLIPKGEATKLARIQIDFPNSVDESWTIDIKKSRARPPHAVRERLRQIIERISTRSTTVHSGRGARLFQETTAPLWERYADQNGIRYALNSTHPLVSALRAGLDSAASDQLSLFLDAVPASLPIEMIYYDYASTPQKVSRQVFSDAEIRDRLRALRAVLFGDGPVDVDGFREVVRSTRLFEKHFDAAERYIEEELR